MLSALPRPVLVVLGLFALALVLFTKDAPDSWADGSRLGTIQGLVEHRTLALDDTDYVHQGDKVQIAGRYYSHQPPMLAILGSLPYTALHRVFGRAIDDPFTYRILTWLLVGLPVLLGLAALARLLLDAGCDPGWAAAWLFLAAFGTLLLPYSLVLNQHGPAAGLALLGLFAATRHRPATAGVLLALAATIDLTADDDDDPSDDEIRERFYSGKPYPGALGGQVDDPEDDPVPDGWELVTFDDEGEAAE